MLFMGFFHIVGDKGEVEFLLAEVIGCITIAQPCQLKGEIRHAVAEVNELKAAVGSVFLAHGLEAERLVVKLQAAFKIEHIEIKMVE